MDALIALTLLLAMAIPLAIVGAYSVVKGPGLIGTIFGFHDNPSWPPGVQEDDAPPRWKLDEPRK